MIQTLGGFVLDFWICASQQVNFNNARGLVKCIQAELSLYSGKESATAAAIFNKMDCATGEQYSLGQLCWCICCQHISQLGED